MMTDKEKEDFGSAGIGAGASLISGLMTNAAQMAANKKKALQDAILAGGKSQGELGESQQKAFQSMMGGMNSALIRR